MGLKRSIKRAKEIKVIEFCTIRKVSLINSTGLYPPSRRAFCTGRKNQDPRKSEIQSQRFGDDLGANPVGELELDQLLNQTPRLIMPLLNRKSTEFQEQIVEILFSPARPPGRFGWMRPRRRRSAFRPRLGSPARKRHPMSTSPIPRSLYDSPAKRVARLAAYGPGRFGLSANAATTKLSSIAS